MKLKRRVQRTITVEAVVTKLIWHGPVDARLMNLPCTNCREKIGDKPWALVWVEEPEKPGRSMRLCETCGKDAEKDYVPPLTDEEKQRLERARNNGLLRRGDLPIQHDQSVAADIIDAGIDQEFERQSEWDDQGY